MFKPNPKLPTYNNVGALALIQKDTRLGQVKIFDKAILTSIAISENGYIGIYQPGMTAKEAELKELRSTSAFNPKWIINSFTKKYEDVPEKLTVIHISNVTEIDLLVDNKSGLGGAITGGLLFGDGGAVVGAMLSQDKEKSIDLQIRTNDFQNPQIIIPLYRADGVMSSIFSSQGQDKLFKGLANVAKGVNVAELRKQEIQELMGVLSNIYNVHQSSKTQNAAIQKTSDADELAKFKKLLDDGIISQDEFEAKKKQLLGL